MRWVSGLLFLLATAALPAQAPQAPMVEHETFLLEFMGGSQPLTSAERAEIRQMVAAEMRSHPQQWMAIDANEQKVIAAIKAAGPAQRAALWDANRHGYGFPPDPGSDYAHNFGDVWLQEKRIVDAHDPVLGLDPAHKLIFTEHMVPAIYRAAEWAGGFYHVPGPDAEFDNRVREAVRGLPGSQLDIEFGLSHIVALEPLIQPEIAKQPALAQQVSKSSYQLNFAGKMDNHNAEQQQLLATTAAASVRWGLHHGSAGGNGGGTAEALYMHKLTLKALHDAAMSFSSNCNPVSNSSETMESYHCRAPVPVPGLP